MDTYVKSYVSYARDILIQCNIPKLKMNLILSAFQDTLYDNTDTQFLKYIEKEILDNEENNKLTNIRNNYIKEITMLLNNINKNTTETETELEEDKIDVKSKKNIKHRNS